MAHVEPAAVSRPVTSTAGPSMFRPDPGFDQRVALFRHGTGTARIRNVELLDDAGQALAAVDFNQEVILRVHVEFYEAAPFCILGYVIRDTAGIDLLGTNTYEENAPIPPRKAGETAVVDYRHRLPLIRGTYSVTVALAYSRESATYFDWIDNALVFDMLPPRDGRLTHTKVWLPLEIQIHA
jgi:lipopolysaccharide transport system ATP-binding protein